MSCQIGAYYKYNCELTDPFPDVSVNVNVEEKDLDPYVVRAPVLTAYTINF